MSARRLFSALLLGTILLCAGCRKNEEAFEIIEPSATPAAPLSYWKLPDFALTERSGQPLRLADLAGKVWVADFFYTTCPGPCPMLSGRFAEVQKALGDEPRVRLVSISVDPEKDTTDVLKLYAERFKAGAGWLFCTGEKREIDTLAREGFKLPLAAATAGGGTPLLHSMRLVLVDQSGTVRGFYDGGAEASVLELIRDIRRLLEAK